MGAPLAGFPALLQGLGGATGIAKGLGGLLDLFGRGRGQPGKFEQVPTVTPEQKQLLNQLIGMLGGEGQLGAGMEESLSQLRELMDPSSEAMQRFADPYMRQFKEETIPGIGERFAGAGAEGGALSSSAFGQALGGAGAGLQTQLAGLKSQLQRGAAQDILGQFQSILGPALGTQPFGYKYTPPSGGYAGGQFF
jgi:hypothetical protein